MIPKVIHYCWFGGNDFSEKEQKCISSWKKYCPDYEIKRWDENNFNVNSCSYVREAYEKGKWAFVSDYARFKILYEYGGVYFDTDVELIARIDDIIENGAFFGLESKTDKSEATVAAGLGMGVEKGNAVYKRIIDYYETTSYLEESEREETVTVVRIVTDIFKEYGFDEKNSFQTINGINLYPSDYFDPLDYYTGEELITDNTRSIHHYLGSWRTSEQKHIQEKQYAYVKKYGKRVGMLLGKHYGIYTRLQTRIRTDGVSKTFKHYYYLLVGRKNNV